MPIYGECGGFMYLCEELIDQSGRRYPMTGCFPFAARMFPQLKALGYREITLSRNTVLGNAGLTIRGHEFHYSELIRLSPQVSTAYRISDRTGMDKPPVGCRNADDCNFPRCFQPYNLPAVYPSRFYPKFDMRLKTPWEVTIICISAANRQPPVSL